MMMMGHRFFLQHNNFFLFRHTTFSILEKKNNNFNVKIFQDSNLTNCLMAGNGINQSSKQNETFSFLCNIFLFSQCTKLISFPSNEIIFIYVILYHATSLYRFHRLYTLDHAIFYSGSSLRSSSYRFISIELLS